MTANKLKQHINSCNDIVKLRDLYYSMVGIIDEMSDTKMSEYDLDGNNVKYGDMIFIRDMLGSKITHLHALARLN